MNPANCFDRPGLVADCCHGQHDLGCVIKCDERELVGGAEVANDSLAGCLGLGERASSHRAAAVENGTEGHWATLPGFCEGCCEFEGEMHGASLIGEDCGMVELGLDFHFLVGFSVCGIGLFILSATLLNQALFFGLAVLKRDCGCRVD